MPRVSKRQDFEEIKNSLAEGEISDPLRSVRHGQFRGLPYLRGREGHGGLRKQCDNRKKIFAESITKGIDTNRFDPRPNLVEVDLLLLHSPSFKCVDTNGSKIFERSLGERVSCLVPDQVSEMLL